VYEKKKQVGDRKTEGATQMTVGVYHFGERFVIYFSEHFIKQIRNERHISVSAYELRIIAKQIKIYLDILEEEKAVQT